MSKTKILALSSSLKKRTRAFRIKGAKQAIRRAVNEGKLPLSEFSSF